MLHVISLADPAPVEVAPGDTVRVDMSFDYRGKAQSVPVYAGIGHYGLFGWNAVEPNEGTVEIDVDSPEGFTTYEAGVLISIASNLSASTYDIMAEVVGHSETRVIAGGMVVVTGAVGGMTDMLMMIFPLMMLGMIMPMVIEGFEGEEAEPAAV
jgi:hypothetical protein